MSATRLLLFGTPGAGKSSLLTALAQASPTFKAKLVDQSDALQRFSVTSTKGTVPAPDEITVLDCNGKSALEMLQAKDPFAKPHPMKNPVFDADAIMLVVDASLSNKQLTDEFRQFTNWLTHLQEIRGRRAEIADLPIFFVLAKCDLLARKDDTFREWLDRIDERKNTFAAHLRKQLEQHETGFGTIKLQLSATATKRPAFTDKPAKTQEPFGVAELFRECLRSANDFQERRQTSQSRLQNVLVGLLGVVVVLALSVIFLLEFQPASRGTTLDERVQAALPKPDAPAVARLQGTVKKLEDRQAELTAIESDADFERLPSGTREAVSRYRGEIAKYLQRNQESQTTLKLPHLAKNDAELKKQEKDVQTFSLPEAFASDWEETRLGRHIRHVRREYESLHAALLEEDAWIRRQIEKNRALLKSGNRLYGKLLDQEKDAPQEAKKWTEQYREQMNARPLTPRDENVPGVSRILYEDLGKFEPVKTAQKEWKSSKDDLTGISDFIQKKLKAG